MKSIGTFLKEVRAEMARVEWPKPEEFIGATVVTLLFVFFFTVYFAFFDNIIQWVLYKQIFGYVRS